MQLSSINGDDHKDRPYDTGDDHKDRPYDTGDDHKDRPYVAIRDGFSNGHPLVSKYE